MKKKNDKPELKSWIIYLWRNGDVMEGASAVVTRDELKEIYQHGWEIEKVPEAQLNQEKHQVFRAKVKVKNLLNNTLNVINWYGKKVLDSRGEIDTEKLRCLEANTAMQAVKNKVSMEDLYKIRKFPQKEITVDEAVSLGLTQKK